jgi:hypothetical protein
MAQRDLHSIAVTMVFLVSPKVAPTTTSLRHICYFQRLSDVMAVCYAAEIELLRLPRGSVSSCSFGLLLTNTIGTSFDVLLLCQHLANIHILTPPILRLVPFSISPKHISCQSVASLLSPTKSRRTSSFCTHNSVRR